MYYFEQEERGINTDLFFKANQYNVLNGSPFVSVDGHTKEIEDLKRRVKILEELCLSLITDLDLKT